MSNSNHRNPKVRRLVGPRYRQRFAGWLASLFILFTLAHPVAAQGLWDTLLTGVELLIGDSVAANVVMEYGEPITLPPAQQKWVHTIFDDIVAQASRKEIPYQLKVLGTDVVNAFAAPGGHIFITTGLLQHIGPDTDALANVLGHEVAHVEHRHGMNGLLRQLGIGLLLQLAFSDSEDTEILQTIVIVATELMQLGFSREQEHESDDLGQRLAARAGYDPQGMVRFFNVLRDLEGAEVPFLQFLSTHPLTSDRTQRAETRAASLTVATRPGGPVTAPSDIGTTPTEPPAGGRGRVITRQSPSGPSRSVYQDPAERFSLELPVGWQAQPTLYYATTQFDGPANEGLWVSVVDRQPEDTDAIAYAERTLGRYPDLFHDFVIEMRPEYTQLAGIPAAYAEYRYTEAGSTMREGSYFVLHGDYAVLLQFAAPRNLFTTTKDAVLAIGDTLSLGPRLHGHVSPDTLRTWQTVTRTLEEKLSFDVSELWVPIWSRDPQDTEETQLIELTELGEAGWLGLWVFDVTPSTRSEETATDWLDYLLETMSEIRVIQPVHPRPLGTWPGASFIAEWDDNGTLWTHYAVSAVYQGQSVEVLIGYRSDGFAPRRPVFDAWLDSFRILQ